MKLHASRAQEGQRRNANIRAKANEDSSELAS